MNKQVLVDPLPGDTKRAVFFNHASSELFYKGLHISKGTHVVRCVYRRRREWECPSDMLIHQLS